MVYSSFNMQAMVNLVKCNICNTRYIYSNFITGKDKRYVDEFSRFYSGVFISVCPSLPLGLFACTVQQDSFVYFFL